MGLMLYYFELFALKYFYYLEVTLYLLWCHRFRHNKQKWYLKRLSTTDTLKRLKQPKCHEYQNKQDEDKSKWIGKTVLKHFTVIMLLVYKTIFMSLEEHIEQLQLCSLVKKNNKSGNFHFFKNLCTYIFPLNSHNYYYYNENGGVCF